VIPTTYSQDVRSRRLRAQITEAQSNLGIFERLRVRADRLMAPVLDAGVEAIRWRLTELAGELARLYAGRAS
jgi:hypothetical protein